MLKFLFVLMLVFSLSYTDANAQIWQKLVSKVCSVFAGTTLKAPAGASEAAIKTVAAINSAGYKTIVCKIESLIYDKIAGRLLFKQGEKAVTISNTGVVKFNLVHSILEPAYMNGAYIVDVQHFLITNLGLRNSGARVLSVKHIDNLANFATIEIQLTESAINMLKML